MGTLLTRINSDVSHESHGNDAVRLGSRLSNREAPTAKPECDGAIERKVGGKEILPRGSRQIADRDSGLAKRKHSDTELLRIQRQIGDLPDRREGKESWKDRTTLMKEIFKK